MRYLLLTLLLLFTACSTKDYTHTQSRVVIIKSPLIKFADLGYIRNTDESVSLELFIAGARVQKIDINHLICVDEGCMSRGGFNADYLNENYPDNLLQNILLAHPIFDSQNLKRTDDGFEQRIISKNIEILYKVTSKITYFKDKKNKILIKIKSI